MIAAIHGILEQAPVPVEAIAYRNRVQADGGIVHNFTRTVDAFNLLIANNLFQYLESWVSPVFGVKFINTQVSKAYGISGVTTSGHIPDVSGAAGVIPIWQLVNGRPALVYDGSTQDLRNGYLTGITGNQDRTAIYQATLDAVKAQQFPIGIGENANGKAFLLGAINADDMIAQYGATLQAQAATKNANRNILRGVKTASNLKLYKNGALLAENTNAPSTMAVPNFYVGRATFDGGNLKGSLEHSIVFSKALTTAEGTLIENFINSL